MFNVVGLQPYVSLAFPLDGDADGGIELIPFIIKN